MRVDLSRRRTNLSYNVRLLGSMDIGPIHRVVDILVVGHHAYLCMPNEGILVLSIADPRRPHVVSNWGWWQEHWQPIRMKIVGDYAYVVGNTLGRTPTLGLRILDISHPSRPRETGSCFLEKTTSWEPFYWSVAVSGTHAYVAFGGNLLWIVDVADPATPEEASSVLTDVPITAVEVCDKMAYLLSQGLQVYDVRDPSNPVMAGRRMFKKFGFAVPHPPPNETNICRQMALAGDRLYVTDQTGGYRIYDISDPRSQVRIGEMPITEDRRDVDLVVNGDFALMLELGPKGHVQVLDVTDPVKPVTTGFRDIPYPSHCLTAVGDHLYIAGFTHFGVYDCSAAMKKSK